MPIRKEVTELSGMQVRAINKIYLGKLYEKSWGTEFAWKETLKILTIIENEALKLDLRSLNKEELDILGFMPFDESRYAIPAYMRKAAIAQGLMDKNSDTDTRFGQLWAFITPVNNS